MKRTIAIALLLVLIIGILGGCAAKSEAKSDGPIKIGVLAPITGANAEHGKSYQVATNMAVREINAAGGINGRELELIFKDSESDQQTTADMASSLAEDDSILAILGEFSSGCSMAAAPIADEAKITLLSPTASAADFAPMSEYAFSIAGRQDSEAPCMAKTGVKEYFGASSVGILYLNNDWGVNSLKYFEDTASQIGLTITAKEGYAEGESDFSAILSKVRSSDPECLVIVDQLPTKVLNQLAQTDWDVKVACLGCSTSQQIIELCGEAAEGIIVTSSVFYSDEEPATKEFADKFEAEAGFSPTAMAAYEYDAVYVLSEALKACGSDLTRQNIRDNLAKVSGTYLSGPIKFEAQGDIYRSYMICQVENGAFVVKVGF